MIKYVYAHHAVSTMFHVQRARRGRSGGRATWMAQTWPLTSSPSMAVVSAKPNFKKSSEPEATEGDREPVHAHMLHVWNIYLHIPTFIWGKCR